MTSHSAWELQGSLLCCRDAVPRPQVVGSGILDSSHLQLHCELFSPNKRHSSQNIPLCRILQGLGHNQCNIRPLFPSTPQTHPTHTTVLELPDSLRLLRESELRLPRRCLQFTIRFVITSSSPPSVHFFLLSPGGRHHSKPPSLDGLRG